MRVEPYLIFNGRCAEAIEFYKKAAGAQVEMVMKFKDAPQPCDPSQMAPNYDDKIMHASFKIGDSVVMASDGRGPFDGKTKFEGFSLSISVKDAAEADRVYAALAEGGEQYMPLSQTFFSPRFGMLTDKFGVMWMVIVPQ